MNSRALFGLVLALVLAVAAGRAEAEVYWSSIATACTPVNDAIQGDRYVIAPDNYVAPKPGDTNPIVLVCNVPRQDGTSLPRILSMTYLDSTGANTAAKVQAQFVRVAQGTGGRAVVATVSSNSFPQTGTAYHQSAQFGHVLNFDAFYYYVRIEIDRAASNQNLRSLGVALESTCGDGQIQAAETCDDGDNTSGDGCSAICKVETGYHCSGAPSVCTLITLQSIAVTPENPSIFVGATQQFTATGSYSDGTTKPLTTTAIWSSQFSAVASISNASGSRGLATAAGVGATEITAAVGAIGGSTQLTVPLSIASFGPALSYARVGATSNAPTFPQPLTVTLSGPSQGDTQVSIMSGNAALTTSNVVIPNGSTSTTVPVTALAQNADVTVTATLGTQTRTAHVRVLGAAEPPSSVTLSPANVTIAPQGSAQFTVTLDVPSPMNESVSLAISPPGAGTVPANVAIFADQTSATFSYIDGGTASSVTITATFGASTSDATVTID
jgi:cysteine-rich repeat protein